MSFCNHNIYCPNPPAPTTIYCNKCGMIYYEGEYYKHNQTYPIDHTHCFYVGRDRIAIYCNICFLCFDVIDKKFNYPDFHKNFFNNMSQKDWSYISDKKKVKYRIKRFGKVYCDNDDNNDIDTNDTNDLMGDSEHKSGLTKVHLDWEMDEYMMDNYNNLTNIFDEMKI